MFWLRCLLLAAVERVLNEFTHEIALPGLTAQSVNARLRSRSRAEMDGFIEEFRLRHISTNTGIGFFHPVPASRSFVDAISGIA